MATAGSKDHKCTPGDDQSDTKMCDPCSRAHRRTLATVFCETCNGNMCNDCCVKHMMYAIGHHNITDINIRRNVDGTNNLELEVETSSDFEDSSQAQPLQLLKTLDMNSIKKNYKGQIGTHSIVTALDFLPDGRLVAIDHFKCMFYVFDEQLNGCIGWYNFENEPEDMACYTEQNVAVTFLPCMIALLSVSRDGDILLMRWVVTSFPFQVISKIDTQSFLVGTWDKEKPLRTVDVLGNEGYMSNVSLPSTFYKGSEYIVLAKLLALTVPTQNIVYLKTVENNTGKLVKDKRILCPVGVCAGPRGTIFVCCEDNHCLVQLSQQGDVLTSYDVSMQFPRYVRVSRDGTRMAVANANKNNGMIKLFKTPS